MVDQRPEEKLSPVLQFMRALWGLDHGLQIASKRMESRLGITGPQRLVVRLVGHFPGISAGELAELQRLHPSTLTGVLRRLEERGILRRRSDPKDARRALLSLTPKGTRLNELKEGTVEQAVEEALATVPEASIEAAIRTLTAIMTTLDRQSAQDTPDVRSARARR